MSYQHFSAEERHTLMSLLKMGCSYREIGEQLERSHTSIGREIRRNSPLGGLLYQAKPADTQARARKRAPRHCEKRHNVRLYKLVIGRLKKGWSPDAISGWHHRHYVKNVAMHVSAGTIYRWIYADASTGGSHYVLLSFQHKKRKKRRISGLAGSGIPNRIGIAKRPKSVDLRKTVGHWEGDTVEGSKGTGGLATHVERKSRYLIAKKLVDKSARVFWAATLKGFKDIPDRLCKTLTLDNGTENVLHHKITQTKNMRVYFANTHSPWQRGTNEQTNGLLRRYFPKGTDFSKVSAGRIQEVVKLINQRPRKSLNYQTPEEVFFRAAAGAL